MATKAAPATEEPASAMEAIDEALGLGATEEPEIPDVEEPTDDDASDDSDADEEGDEGAEDDAEGDGEDDAEGEDEPVAELNADGTPKDPKAAGKKAPDPINDPIPKDLKRETSDRMKALVGIAKERETELVQVRGEFDTIINGIKASGSTPEQYGEVMSFMQLFNSPDPQARTKAYELVNEVADRLAMMLNIDRTAANPLKDYPDLVQAVQTGKISPEYAREIARTRGTAAFTGQIQSGQRQQQQTQAQAVQEHQDARTALNTLEAQLRASDPLYEAKRRQIVPILKTIMPNIPKNQWAATFKNAYDNAQVKPRSKDGTFVAAPLKQQPMRGNKQPAGGQTRQAGSAMEAMNGALAGMKN